MVNFQQRTLCAPLVLLLVVAVLCLQFQHAVLFSHTTLTERLQQVPTQVENAFEAIEDGTAEPTRGGLRRRHGFSSMANASRSSLRQRSGGRGRSRRGTATGGGTGATADLAADAGASAATRAGKLARHAAKELSAAATANAAIIAEAVPDAAASMAAERPPADAVGAATSKCAKRSPYHVVLTAASGLYQEWQTRIAYYHYKKLKAEHYCSDIGGFTRLLNTPNAQPDGLIDKIPTIVVSQLGHGSCDTCDHGFIVMNRPWGIRQLTQHAAFAAIPEQCASTDTTPSAGRTSPQPPPPVADLRTCLHSRAQLSAERPTACAAGTSSSWKRTISSSSLFPTWPRPPRPSPLASTT